MLGEGDIEEVARGLVLRLLRVCTEVHWEGHGVGVGGWVLVLVKRGLALLDSWV